MGKENSVANDLMLVDMLCECTKRPYSLVTVKGVHLGFSVNSCHDWGLTLCGNSLRRLQELGYYITIESRL
jgi:hypothetical protein